MLENKVVDNLEVIHIENGAYGTTVRADGLSKIRHLKLLTLLNVNFSGSISHLSSEIGYLTWKKYPFQCLPPSFQPNKLVELYLIESNIQRLWEGIKPLHSLKRLNLSHSKNLVELPNVREALNLESIELEGCIQLRKINQSIGLLNVQPSSLTMMHGQNLIAGKRKFSVMEEKR
ncbi:hypothetical protein VNO80_25530 [Phaseolus coccineus]|uniref:Uncharacterized protein n=1 Tax=Phaseolus coccineus TaxID=3886 RepID=A0AAN9QM07_PHACN